WNSGRLPDAMTGVDLRTTHPSRLINPDIAQVCFLYGLMERRGIGTQKIIRACVESGLPEPEWRGGGNGGAPAPRRAGAEPAGAGGGRRSEPSASERRPAPAPRREGEADRLPQAGVCRGEGASGED